MSQLCRSPIAAGALACALFGAACSSTGDDASPTTSTIETNAVETSTVDTQPEPTTAPETTQAATTTAAVAPLAVEVPVPNVVAAVGGEGVRQPLSTAPLPDGWTEEEFLFGGEATSFAALQPIDSEGFWDSEPIDTAEYQTRLIVRRPPADQFSGTVLIEWMNVSAGTDTTPDWGFLAEEPGRSGHAYIAVSAQAVGVVGAEESAVGDLVSTAGLPGADPERYGTLRHPGDAYSFDIMSQAGQAAWSADILGDLESATVIAIGESQSAFFLTTYVNAIHPLVNVFDGFLIHSRGSGSPSPSGDRETGGTDVRIRTDVDVPVFTFQAETDLNRLGYATARQDDSENIVTWEVAGTAHADAYTLSVSTGSPRDPSLGDILSCETGINDGPHHETLQAATRHLVAWVVDGTAPPTSPDIEVEIDESTGDISIVRDEYGLGLGGIRTPPVDVPARIVSGDPGSDSGFCGLFGQTIPFEPDVLAALYSSEADYLEKLQASADNAVDAGWLLPEDAETLVAEEAARAAALNLG